MEYFIITKNDANLSILIRNVHCCYFYYLNITLNYSFNFLFATSFHEITVEVGFTL